MNLLKNINRNLCSYGVSRSFYAEPLLNRDVIRINGTEALQFLQGLITNDMNHLERGASSMYTMFLNKAGRVLYDSIVYKTIKPDTYLVECDKSISNELRRHLRLFRVRKKIDIDSISNDYVPWVIFSKTTTTEYLTACSSEDIVCTQDPRVKALGTRFIVPKSYDIIELAKILPNDAIVTLTKDEYNYRLHRYRLGIGEGTEDHPPTKCFPLEANCDFLHGISFQKGCYLGQELTARVYHTGVIRKRLMPVILENKILESAENVQLQNGTNVGKIRGINDNILLALIRIEQAMKAKEIFVNGKKAQIYTPDWWPKELPNKMPLSTMSKDTG